MRKVVDNVNPVRGSSLLLLVMLLLSPAQLLASEVCDRLEADLQATRNQLERLENLIKQSMSDGAQPVEALTQARESLQQDVARARELCRQNIDQTDLVAHQSVIASAKLAWTAANTSVEGFLENATSAQDKAIQIGSVSGISEEVLDERERERRKREERLCKLIPANCSVGGDESATPTGVMDPEAFARAEEKRFEAFGTQYASLFVELDGLRNQLIGVFYRNAGSATDNRWVNLYDSVVRDIFGNSQEHEFAFRSYGQFEPAGDQFPEVQKSPGWFRMVFAELEDTYIPGATDGQREPSIACNTPAAPPAWFAGSWGGMLAASDGTAFISFVSVAQSGVILFQHLNEKDELQTLTGLFQRVDQSADPSLDICIAAGEGGKPSRIIGLDFDWPESPASADGLVGEISVLEPGTGEGGGSSGLTEKVDDPLHGGTVALYRGSPVVSSVQFIDLPPLPILNGIMVQEPPELTKLLSEAYGDGIMVAAWLRLRGLDLPTQEGRQFSLKFDDPSLNWTGEVRVPFQVQPEAAPEVFDVRVTLTKETLPGPKRFRLNGTEAIVRFGGEPSGIAVIAEDALSGSWTPVNEVVLGVPFAIGVIVEGARYDPVDVILGQRSATSKLELVLVQSQGINLFQSRNVLLTDGGDGLNTEQMTYGGGPGGEIHVRVLNDYGQSSELGSVARIIEPEPGIWNAALRRARACRAAGGLTSISALILTPNFFEGRILPESLEVNISLEDHAAAIVLRDEMMQLLGQYIDIEEGFLRTPPGEARMEVRQIIKGARRLLPRVWHDDTVGAPVTGELIPLITALGRRMEAASFNGDQVRFEKYADNAIRVARGIALERVRDRLNDIRGLNDVQNMIVSGELINVRVNKPCEIENLLRLMRPGVRALVASAAKKLVRPARANDEPGRLWVPDQPVLKRLATIGKLIEAIDAVNEYNDLDTVAAISYAAVPLGFAISGTAGMMLGGVLDIGTMAAFTGADWYESVESLEFEDDLEAALGQERLKYALTLEKQKALELDTELTLMVVIPAGFAVAQRVGSKVLTGAMKNAQLAWLPTKIIGGIEALERFARRQARIAWSKVRPTSASRLDDVAYRQAVANAGDSIKASRSVPIGQVGEILPPGKFVGGTIDEVAEQLERLGIPRDEAEILLRRLQGHGLPPDAAAARILMRRGIDPGNVMAKLNLVPDDFARLLDLEMIVEGITDPILRAKKIRDYMGADFTPQEIYFLAETGKGLFNPDPYGNRPGDRVGDQIISMHPKQMQEIELMQKFERFGRSPSGARRRARIVTEAFEPSAVVSGFYSPHIQRNPVQWGGFDAKKLDPTLPSDSNYLFRRPVVGELDGIPEGKHAFRGGEHEARLQYEAKVPDILGDQEIIKRNWQVPGKRIIADSGTFIELGDVLGEGAFSAILRDAANPGKRVVRVNRLKSESGFVRDEAIVADHVGRHVGEAIQSENGLFRLTIKEGESFIVRDPNDPKVRYLISLEESIEDTVAGISNAKERFSKRLPNEEELATMNLAIREMNRRGVIWTDHKLANFDIVPNQNTSTRYQMVIFDTGGIRPVRGATPETRRETARELQRFFDETPSVSSGPYAPRLLYYRNQAVIDPHVDDRVFGRYAPDYESDYAPLMSSGGRDRSDGYHDLNRLSRQKAKEVLSEILGRDIQLPPIR